MKSNEDLIRGILERRKLWEGLYSSAYVERFFRPYDGELEALLELAKSYVETPVPTNESEK